MTYADTNAMPQWTFEEKYNAAMSAKINDVEVYRRRQPPSRSSEEFAEGLA